MPFTPSNDNEDKSTSVTDTGTREADNEAGCFALAVGWLCLVSAWGINVMAIGGVIVVATEPSKEISSTSIEDGWSVAGSIVGFTIVAAMLIAIVFFLSDMSARLIRRSITHSFCERIALFAGVAHIVIFTLKHV